MEGKRNMADRTDEELPVGHVSSLKGSGLSSTIYTETPIHESVHTIQKKKNVTTELVNNSNDIFTQSQISPCRKNQAIEATSPKSPNITLRRKSHSKNRENPSESIPAVRKKSIADITSKEEQIGETLSADFGHKLFLGNEEIDNELYEMECSAEENKQQSISSPKLFRRRKSLVKDGELSEQSSSLVQQQNLIGKTDNNEMSQSAKKYIRKKSIRKKIEEKHLLLHTQTDKSNSRIVDGKTKIDRWHERKHSNVCNVQRENCSLECQQRSDITKVANGNVRRNVLQRRKSVGIVEERGIQMSISVSGQASGHSVRRTSEVNNSNRYANGKEVACKSTKVIRKKKKKKRVSRADGRPLQQSYNGSDSSDHQHEINDNCVVSRTTQESTAKPNLAHDFEGMNIQTPIRRRSRLMTTSAKYNDDIVIQCQSGDIDTVIPETGLCDNAYIDSHQHIDNMKGHMPPFEAKERKSIQDSNGIARQKSRSPRVRKRTKYIEVDIDANKRTTSLSPLERQRKQPTHIEDNKKQPSDCPRARRNNSKHTQDIGRVASLSPLARQRGRSAVQNADDVSPQAPISPLEHRAIQGADVTNRQSSTSPRLRQRKAMVQYNDCVKKVAPISPLAKESLRDYVDVASPLNPQDAEKDELAYQRREPVQDMDLNDLTNIPPLIRYRRKSRQDVDIRSSPGLQRREIPIQDPEHENQINRSPLVQHRMQTIHDNDLEHQMTTSRKIPQSPGPDSDTRESNSTYARQRRRSFQEVDVNNQLSMSPSLRRRRTSIQDVDVNNQLSMSPSMRRRRKSIQDVDLNNQRATSPYLGQRTPIGGGIDIQQCMSPSTIMSKGVRQRRKSIDVDLNTQVVMSPSLRHQRISIDSDINIQQFGISTSANVPQSVRQRKQSIQDLDVNSQLPVSPSMRRRKKSVQDIACVGRRTSIGADIDSQQCMPQTLMVPKGARQRRKSIQDVDLNTQIATSTYVGRRTSIDTDINSQQFCASPFLSQGVRQRRKSIQDVDNNSQLPMSPRLRHRRKSVQEAVDLKMQAPHSPIIRRKIMSFGDHKDGTTGTYGCPNLHNRGNTGHDIDGNASLGNMSPIVRHGRKSFQDSDDAMKYASFSPRLQRRRTSINDNDENKVLLASPSYLQDLKSINPHQYDMKDDPFLRQKYMSEDEINMAMRSRPRRASLQDGDRMMPLSPNSLLHRGKYYTDLDGTIVHQSFSPSLQRRRQINTLGGREGQKGSQRSFDYSNLGSPGNETLLTHPTDNLVLVSGGQSVADSRIDEDDPVKPERKRSLSLSNILDKEMSDQLGMLRSATSATVLSFNLDVSQSLDGHLSPSPGRESKPTLIQKDIREKLAKSARRSSFPAVLDPLSVGPLSGLKGRNMEIKQTEQTDNVGPFSRRARKASLTSKHSQSQNFQDKDLEKPRLKRKTSLPVGMLTHLMPQEHEVVAHDLSLIQNATNPVSCKHKTRRMSQDSEEMATGMACRNTDNFGGARRKTRRMSLPDTLMFSSIADFSVQSFCHQIPGNIRRVPGAKYIQNPFEQQSNLCIQRPINPCGDDTNFPGDDFANTMMYPPISNEDMMLHEDETIQTKEEDELEEILQCQTPVVSPVISDLDRDKQSEQDEVMPCLSRQDSIISDITLPPRTPEPEVMAEFSQGNGEGSQADEVTDKPNHTN